MKKPTMGVIWIFFWNRTIQFKLFLLMFCCCCCNDLIVLLFNLQLSFDKITVKPNVLLMATLQTFASTLVFD